MPEVQIVELEPTRVVAALGYGETPEYQAWELINEYIAEREIKWPGQHRFFGFNNPDPTPGSPNYGYEQWITVDDDVNVDPPLETKRFSGGQYAALHLRGLKGIGEAWKQLVAWVEEEGYNIATTEHNCLEELRTPLDAPQDEWEFDLYLGVSR